MEQFDLMMKNSNMIFYKGERFRTDAFLQEKWNNQWSTYEVEDGILYWYSPNGTGANKRVYGEYSGSFNIYGLGGEVVSFTFEKGY